MSSSGVRDRMNVNLGREKLIQIKLPRTVSRHKLHS